MTKVLNYYSEPGVMTNLFKHKAFTDWLTADPGAIYQVAQGLLVHDLWISLYGEAHSEAHDYPQITATMSDLLDKALALDGSSLAIPRHPRERVVACCREFATLMCALLRAKGIPARSRCGFAVYFDWNVTFEDHWICEYWNGSRWVRADPQLDPFQQSTIITWALKGGQNAETLSRLRQLNPRDLKPDEFLTAGQAWRLCRGGKADPDKFGIGCPNRPEWGIDSLFGLWFVRGQLLRDFASLNKVETVPYLARISKGLDWKPWRLMALKDSEMTEEDLSLLDHIAELTEDADGNFDEIRETYLTNKELAVPAEIIAR